MKAPASQAVESNWKSSKLRMCPSKETNLAPSNTLKWPPNSCHTLYWCRPSDQPSILFRGIQCRIACLPGCTSSQLVILEPAAERRLLAFKLMPTLEANFGCFEAREVDEICAVYCSRKWQFAREMVEAKRSALFSVRRECPNGRQGWLTIQSERLPRLSSWGVRSMFHQWWQLSSFWNFCSFAKSKNLATLDSGEQEGFQVSTSCQWHNRK